MKVMTLPSCTEPVSQLHVHLQVEECRWRGGRRMELKAAKEGKVFLFGGNVPAFPLRLSAFILSLSLSLSCCRSSGRLPSSSQDRCRPDLILQGSRDTMCACVCVSLPGSYPHIIIKGDICVTLHVCVRASFFLSPLQVSVCVYCSM